MRKLCLYRWVRFVTGPRGARYPRLVHPKRNTRNGKNQVDGMKKLTPVRSAASEFRTDKEAAEFDSRPPGLRSLLGCLPNEIAVAKKIAAAKSVGDETAKRSGVDTAEGVQVIRFQEGLLRWPGPRVVGQFDFTGDRSNSPWTNHTSISTRSGGPTWDVSPQFPKTAVSRTATMRLERQHWRNYEIKASTQTVVRPVC